MEQLSKLKDYMIELKKKKKKILNLCERAVG